MKISRKAKTGCAVVLAALMTLTGLTMKQTYAAEGVDLNRDCSITVSVNKGPGYNTSTDAGFKADFKNMRIPIALYRVADVDVTGQNFTVLEPFKGVVDLSDIADAKDGATYASEWLDKADKAAKVENLKDTAHLEAETDTATGTAVFKSPDVRPGMYLVMPGEKYNPEYTVKYTFTPYLTMLPSSEYTLTGQGSDAWNYNPEIGLKPQAEPQYGKLIIRKSLDSYNTTLGEVTFVYEVRDAETNGEVYHEVAATNHKDLAEQSVTLEHIPAGITVNVEEIYRGASYEIVEGDPLKKEGIKIWSDAAVDMTEGTPQEIKTAEVSFQNKYNGGNRGGYGVTNQFTSGAAGWNWDSIPQVTEPGTE